MRLAFLSLAVLVLVACGSARQGSRSAHTSTPRVTAVEAPLPSNAKGRFEVGLTDVACAAPGSCAAAGYLSSNTISRGLLLVEQGGAWSVDEPPLPQVLRPGRRSEGVSSVACPAAGHCVAVGYAASGSQLVPLVFTQRPHGWQETVLAKRGSLDLVSCPSTGNCTAAGGQELFDERKGEWGPPTTPGLPPNAAVTTASQTFGEPLIQGLSCWAAGNCAAVGVYGDKHGSPQGWLLTETDGAWAPGVEARLPANASTTKGAYLYPVIDITVSCAPSGDCTAVGGYADSASNQYGMILSEHDGSWGPAKQTPLPANAGPNPQQGNSPRSPMGSVACPTSGSCSAVGWYVDNHMKYHGLLLDEAQGTWTPGQLVFPSGGHASAGISLDSVACPSAGNCFAVGSYNPNPSRLRPLLVAAENGTWSKSFEPPQPEGADENYNGSLVSVSCPAAKTCVAVGDAESAKYLDQRGLIVTIGRS